MTNFDTTNYNLHTCTEDHNKAFNALIALKKQHSNSDDAIMITSEQKPELFRVWVKKSLNTDSLFET
jgi:hypothetical protein